MQQFFPLLTVLEPRSTKPWKLNYPDLVLPNVYDFMEAARWPVNNTVYPNSSLCFDAIECLGNMTHVCFHRSTTEGLPVGRSSRARIIIIIINLVRDPLWPTWAHQDPGGCLKRLANHQSGLGCPRQISTWRHVPPSKDAS